MISIKKDTPTVLGKLSTIKPDDIEIKCEVYKNGPNLIWLVMWKNKALGCFISNPNGQLQEKRMFYPFIIQYVKQTRCYEFNKLYFIREFMTI